MDNFVYSLMIAHGGTFLGIYASMFIIAPMGYDLDKVLDEHMGLILLISSMLWMLILSIIIITRRYKHYKAQVNSETNTGTPKKWVDKTLVLRIMGLLLSPVLTIFGVGLVLPPIIVYFEFLKGKNNRLGKSQGLPINREEYYLQTKKFFEEGLLKEIYGSDKISICNVANAFYIVSNYTITDEGPLVVILASQYMEALMENDSLFSEFCGAMGNKLKKSCGFLNEKTYEYLKQVKTETDVKGPYIDLEYEKSLTSQYSK